VEHCNSTVDCCLLVLVTQLLLSLARHLDATSGQVSDFSFVAYSVDRIITSSQSYLTKGRIAATHRWFSRIANMHLISRAIPVELFSSPHATRPEVVKISK